MNRQELFVKSVDILVHALQNGKLENMDSCNCAVGNLIAYRKGKYVFSDKWVNVVDEMRIGKDRYNLLCNSIGKVARQNALKTLATTQYTLEEIEKIEGAFENASVRGNFVERRGYDPKEGLLRAIDVLGKIHEVESNVTDCMKDHVKNGTYEFTFEFIESNKSNKSCPIIKE
jgi:hypothetical protein